MMLELASPHCPRLPPSLPLPRNPTRELSLANLRRPPRLSFVVARPLGRSVALLAGLELVDPCTGSSPATAAAICLRVPALVAR